MGAGASYSKATATIALVLLGWPSLLGFSFCATLFWIWGLGFLFPGPL